MPHHQSAKKRLRTNKKANLRNRHYRAMMRTAIKNVRAASEKGEAEKALKETTSILDALVSKGIIHQNKAANQKSKLAKYVNTLS